MSNFDFLYNDTEETTTRFVSFIGPSYTRYDLAVTTTGRFFGKLLVADLQSGATAIIGPDDLEEEGYLERIYKLSEAEGQELREFLHRLVGPVHFTDI